MRTGTNRWVAFDDHHGQAKKAAFRERPFTGSLVLPFTIDPGSPNAWVLGVCASGSFDAPHYTEEWR
jgi:hypothetical protein